MDWNLILNVAAGYILGLFALEAIDFVVSLACALAFGLPEDRP